MKLRDLTGQRFGKLVVLRRDEEAGYPTRWICLCNCGIEKSILAGNILSGNNVSCGCYGANKTMTHGLAGTNEYRIWQDMKRRCSNPKRNNYKDYGGRGITYCPEWNDFSVFIRDMGPRPSLRHSIERRDNNGPYSPDNCYWATIPTQRNNKRNNIFVEFNGSVKTLAEWADELKLNYYSLRYRIVRAKWPVEKAFTTPFK